MMEMDFCYKHPQKTAKWRCYHCKKHICMECRLQLSHHYFCSRKCHRLFHLHNFLGSFKKRRNYFFVGWNIILTMALLALFFYPPGSQTLPPATAPETGSDYEKESPGVFPPPDIRAIDSLLRSGAARRSEILKDKIYTLNIPLEKGSVVTVWQNDWPVISKVVAEAGDAAFPISLKYDMNRIRVGVWNGQQKLIYQDYLEITYRNYLVEALRNPVVRGVKELRQISLTFDGGSNDSGTRDILQILAEKKVITTVFITGQFIENFPELVREILEAGHEVGNHTYDHPHLTTYEENRRHDTRPGVTREYLQRQLLRTDSLFHALTGQHMLPYWRAAFGEYNREILDWAAEAGFMHIGWTNGFDTFDWVHDEESNLFKDPQEVRQTILKKDDGSNGLNGAIVLMHLGTERKNGQMYTMLGELIDDLRAREFEPVTVTKLLNP